MWNYKVLANYFEGALKAIHFSIPTHIIKVSCECLMRHYTNVGGISENSRIGIYRCV